MIIGLVGNGKMAKSVKSISKYNIVDVDFNAFKNEDVVLDFSNRNNLDVIIKYCLENKIPIVVGTTGLTDNDKNHIIEASKYIPIFISSNFSYGIFIIKEILKSIIPLINNKYDIELIETHHKSKIDLPSGTMKDIINTLNYDNRFRININRNKGRECDEIGVHCIRGGSVFGEHKIMFLGEGEKITIEHTAYNRGIFSLGAIKACEFIVKQEKGLYFMEDLIKSGCKISD